MPKSFIVAPLSRAQTDQALPVMQVLHRDMTLAQWRDAVAPFLEAGPDSGVMACEMSDGHIRGLFCWRVRTVGASRVLTIPIFIAVGLFDAAVTSAAQVEAIERLALQRSCRTVEVEQTGCLVAATAPKLDAVGLFTRLGYWAGEGLLAKEVWAEDAGTGFPVQGVA